MSRPVKGRDRRAAIVSLCPENTLVIDVGADHGYVAQALGGIATERQPHRIRGRRETVPWVIADGLTPFRSVPVAVIAGMGAHTIAHILNRGPRPQVVVLHAQDDPSRLRNYLAANGWRIEAEALAEEAGRHAEIIRAVAGTETATGLRLAFGPALLRDGHPLLRDHLNHLHRWWSSLAEQTQDRAPKRWAQAAARVRFLGEMLDEWGFRER